MDGGWRLYGKYRTNTHEHGCRVGASVAVADVFVKHCSSSRSVTSPLLHQQDDDQHQQDEDENPGAEASDLHHAVRLLLRARDDFWLLCCTFNTVTIKRRHSSDRDTSVSISKLHMPA